MENIVVLLPRLYITINCSWAEKCSFSKMISSFVHEKATAETAHKLQNKEKL